MKSIQNIVVVTCVALMASSSAFAKKPKPTLADFKGSYTGTATLSAPGIVASGPCSLTFSSNKTGKTGGISVSGSISGTGTTLPVSAGLSLSSGSMSIDNFVFNVLAQGSFPGLASYTVGKNTISFSGSATVTGTVYPYSGTITTRTKGRTQTLTFTTTELISGFPYVFTFTVTRHVKVN